MNELKNLISLCLKALPVGTTRNWGGVNYKKMPNGKWQRVTTGEQPSKGVDRPKETDNKKEKITFNNATKEDLNNWVDRNTKTFEDQDFGSKEFQTTYQWISNQAKNAKGRVKENPETISEKLDYIATKQYEKMKPIYEKKEKEYREKIKQGQKK